MDLLVKMLYWQNPGVLRVPAQGFGEKVCASGKVDKGGG